MIYDSTLLSFVI